ncbi:MAG: thio(seleno)oxazole modification radical SAM maturase SbtM [Geobacteraceae bacterium]|nr:thio(seleno)oxazole modification radical SAM maturase SbtM [Geobacteraceae bacterium]
MVAKSDQDLDPETVPALLAEVAGLTHPEWLPDFARLELACYRAMNIPLPDSSELPELTVNPSLQQMPVPWKHLLTLLTFAKKQDMDRIEPGNELVLIWSDPANKNLRFETAMPDHLLALKMAAERTRPEEAARQTGKSIAQLDALLWDAVRKGILLAPGSYLRRSANFLSATGAQLPAAEVFTVQCYLTPTVHPYQEQGDAPPLPEEFPSLRAISLIQELRHFCWNRFVRPQLAFCGDNLLSHPDFFELYQLSADHGLMTAIQSNATDRETIKRLMEIQRPDYYQVNLEGEEAYNDQIRGAGNFRRTIDFLELLTELGVPNMVQLTLTRDNLDQVIPLAKTLEGITGGLTFNRLTLSETGSRFILPTRDTYRDFLQQYLAAVQTHPVLVVQDNLLNILCEEQGKPLSGGCTGYGCGAAFNTIAILPDGTVHACRKLSSPIGNILTQSLEDVYNSEAAARYRDGSTACNGCKLKPVCGGCLAVTASFGHDPLTSKDPYCFRI